MVHSEIARNRGAGAGNAKKIQCHRNETILQLCERGIANYQVLIDVLALAPQEKCIYRYLVDTWYDIIVTRQFYNCHGRGLPLIATLVDAAGSVWLLLSVWSEYREMRISCAHYLRLQLLCCFQRENKTSSVASLSLLACTKNERHCVEKKKENIAMKTCERAWC